MGRFARRSPKEGDKVILTFNDGRASLRLHKYTNHYYPIDFVPIDGDDWEVEVVGYENYPKGYRVSAIKQVNTLVVKEQEYQLRKEKKDYVNRLAFAQEKASKDLGCSWAEVAEIFSAKEVLENYG